MPSNEPEPLVGRIPATAKEVLEEAAVLNPQVRSSVENVRAAQFARDARRRLARRRANL